MANRISQLRKSINLSQVDLAKQMGVGQSTISNWESEKTTIDSESLTKLSKLLIASAGYILGIEDGPYNGFSEEQYRNLCEERHDEAEAEALIREYEQDESALEDESFNDYRSQCIYEAWVDAGNPGYIESFEIGLMCESLSKEERERLLQVAKLMFPDAVYLTKD